ncbi:class I SAM-dependent methyltransferase [Sphingomonas sp. ABOLG]|uniref:class I SAM-dependent methyltransferase n=1 Tax=Sphingomonas sp. ABOLG TaxID=1985880 RepID=UPI000F7F97DD|nr:class I SAM-dependent methyltransferase [Sphingomonas sp. ABOLG]
MAVLLHKIADVSATALGGIAAPALRFMGKHHNRMTRFQALQDRAGFQVRTTHYYEPTYAEHDLPADTQKARFLPGFDMNEGEQLALLRSFHFAEELRAFPDEKPREDEYGYDNRMYSYGDAEILYNMIRLKKPARIIEIGSGQSTLMARAAIAANKRNDEGYTCAHICIEPYEMPWLERTGVTVVRERVEDLDLAFFDALDANDILFIDSSHVIRPWGDVLREFHQIVPSVTSGVIVHVHDIFTPYDYPETWLRQDRRLWNEQYLMESFLCYNSQFKVICANHWLKQERFYEFVAACPMTAEHPDAKPGGFWFQRI